MSDDLTVIASTGQRTYIVETTRTVTVSTPGNNVAVQVDGGTADSDYNATVDFDGGTPSTEHENFADGGSP